MPEVGTCFLVCLDALKTMIAVVVTFKADQYVLLQQVVTDGHDVPVDPKDPSKGSQHLPAAMGNMLGVDETTGQLKLTDPEKQPDGSMTNNPSIQWVPTADLIVNTPAWPDRTKMFALRIAPGAYAK